MTNQAGPKSEATTHEDTQKRDNVADLQLNFCTQPAWNFAPLAEADFLFYGELCKLASE